MLTPKIEVKIDSTAQISHNTEIKNKSEFFSITGESVAATAWSLRSQAQFYIISSHMTHIEV